MPTETFKGDFFLKMEGFIKVPKSLFKQDLTPNERNVLLQLIMVEDYRQFKGEVNDGWFFKSKNELSKECGFSRVERLNRTLETMLKKGIVEIRTNNTSVTEFKINYTYNEYSDYTQNKSSNYTRSEYLHNNINKNNNETRNILENKNILEKNILEENIEINEEYDLNNNFEIKEEIEMKEDLEINSGITKNGRDSYKYYQSVLEKRNHTEDFDDKFNKMMERFKILEQKIMENIDWLYVNYYLPNKNCDQNYYNKFKETIDLVTERYISMTPNASGEYIEKMLSKRLNEQSNSELQ